jgi:hypothetical protein
MPYDLNKIAPTCVVLTWLYMAAEVVFFAVTFWETGFYRGDFSAGAEMDVEFYVLDLAIMIGAFGMLAAAIGAYVVNGVWIYRAVSNARALDPRPERISPGWAIGWHVIPIANLWMPFRAMKQTWNTSAEAGRDIAAPVGHPFGIWWTCWIISSLIDNASFRMSMHAETNDEWLTVGYIDMASTVLSVIAAYYFLQILREITRAQADQSGVAEVFS